MLSNPFTMAGFYQRGALFLVSLFFSGCALQSSVVDLEEGIDTIQKRQQELLLLAERLDTMNQTQDKSASSSEGRAMLLEKINRLEEQIRSLEGRIEEEGHKVSDSMRTLDDQTHPVHVLPNRIDLLEKRILAMEGKEGNVPPPTRVPPSPSQEGGETQEKEEGKKERGIQGGIVPPTEAYRLAYNDYLRGDYSLAVISFQNYIEQYPNSTFIPEAFYWLGQSYYNKGNYKEAVIFLEQVYMRYPNHENVPRAKTKEAFALVELKEIERAKALLLDVVEQYPQSDMALRAKDELSRLNNISQGPVKR